MLIGRRRLLAALIVVAVVVLGAAGVVAARDRGSSLAGGLTITEADLQSTPTRYAEPVSTDPSTTTTTATVPSTAVPSTPARGTTSAATSSPVTSTTTARKPLAAPTTHRPVSTPKPKPTPKTVHSTTPPATGKSSSGAGRIQFGHTYTGHATFYAATGAGNCSYEASSDLMVGAMNQQDYDNSQSCGAYLAVTGPGGNTITIKVVDRCPECPPGAIDLSRQAFTKLAPASAGLIQISWKLLSPAISGPVAYKYKSGSSQYWCGIQVRNHRNPVRSLALRVDGRWKDIPRLDYNYFVSAGGAGCGGPIRITDIDGHQLTDTGIAITPDAVQPGHAQFGAAA